MSLTNVLPLSQPDNIIYECCFCNIKTHNKKDYNKHILTKKHLKNADLTAFNKSLPDSFCNLINLKELRVDFDNVKKALPENFGNLINLEMFNPGSRLDYLPASFGKLSKLKTLTIRNSTFTEIPMVLTELHNLKSLDLWDNKFADIPNELTKLKSLDLIRFDNNPLASSNSIQKKCKALLPGVEFSF